MFNIPFTHFGTRQIFGPRLFYLGPYTSFNGDSNIKGIYTSTYDSISTPAPFFDSGTGFVGGPYWGFVDRKGRILLAGFFTTYKGITVNRIVRLTPKGDIDKTFNIGTGFNAETRWIAEDSQGRIYVAGNFTTYKGATVNRMVRLFEDGSRDISFTPPSFNGLVISGVLIDDKPIVIGYFTLPRNGIVKLSDTGGIDTSFNVGTGLSPTGSTIFQIKNDASGNVFVVGRFTTYRGLSSRGLVKIKPNGDIDTSFNVGTGFTDSANAGVYTCTIQSDDKVVAGGWSTSYNGTSIKNIVRLMPNGDIDNSFPYDLAFETGTVNLPNIRSVVEDAAGNLYIGGFWSTYDGLLAPNFIKTDSSGSVDTAYLDGTSQFDNTLWHVIPYNTTVDN